MEYDNIRYEEEIDLKELCIFALRKWKLLLGMTLAGALILGIFQSTLSYALIGALLGAFCGAGLLFMQYIFSPKLRNAKELKEQYGYYILSDLSRPESAQAGPFEKLLDRWAGYTSEWEEEKEYRLIAARIQMAVETTPVALMVTGTAKAQLLHEAGERLKALLPKETFRVCTEENITYNEQALTQVRQYAVVLVEEAGESDRQEIAKLVEVLRISKVKVVGVMVL
ncbi:MAG: hypothetical protein HFI39_14455 [Lachnospiraceae bacterium]|jgi:hypothetical protein|nr:hypothetical protein [Lachnospiraceae bacterium]